jgi:cytochrome c oxidase subunit II
MAKDRHLTTRRGAIAAMGFGGVTLYGLWAAYGAAPGPLALFGHEVAHAPGDAHPTSLEVGHAGHGAAPDGLSAEEFRRSVAMFVERYGQPDGSVHPRRESAPAMPREGHAGHAAHAPPTTDAPGDAEPVEAFLLAEKWFYEPAHLRLDVGETYRLRMMATDVSHGASIQFGRGGRMVRLRPNREATLLTTFVQPGSFLVYCTVYCGQAHDFMQSRIEVV